ncbi:Ribonuclease MRP protein subunit rmp1 [Cytospora paraplurivora]|uniref:Ribonuclease MRP protein subunit rmp1 n=1 Tax=Cytospora paraplurivora TaxID=2898453 RepID=A0AAN9U283_9PEZI
MASRHKNDIVSPGLHTLQSSLASLATAAHILDGFVHRNRNQHRGTRWWGPFDMLRRSVRKTLPDLEGAVQRAEVLSASAPSSSGAAKRRKTGRDGHVVAVAVKQPELERVVQRVQWIHDVAGVKAYEAFTQLAADRQFAQLGLALIGVLAQVEAAIAPFVGTGLETNAADEKEPIRVVHAAGIRGEGPSASAILGPSLNSGDDLGVVISRDQLDDDDDTPPKGKDMPLPAPSLRKQERSSKSKVKSSKEEEAVSREDKDSEPQRTGLQEGKRVKKKKKKKGGDEFDDLFSTLL